MIKILAVSLAIVPGFAFAQSAPNWPTGYNPSAAEINAEWASKRDYAPTPVPALPFIYATDYGVIPDGVTPNDVQIKNALTACSAAGQTLILPPGQILLNGTGSASASLENCNVVGSGVPGAKGGVPGSNGTMFLLTSTTISPFLIGSHWSMSGINFYWPNQINGTTVFPALLYNPTVSVAWAFFNNTVINAYTLYDETRGAGTGGWNIHDNYIYAVNTILHSYGQGDTIQFTNNDLTPGPWFNIAPSTSHGAVNSAGQVNKMFDVDGGAGFAWNIVSHNVSSFEWRYAFYIEASGVVGISSVGGWTVDGVGTLIDSSSGGTWAVGNYFQMSGDCNIVGLSSGAHAAPCFNLKNNDYMVISGSQLSTNGSFVEAQGSDVFIEGSQASGIGSQNDGTSYYIVHETANTGGTIVSVRDSVLGGNGASNKTNTHGIVTDVAASRLIVQNSQFQFLNEDVTGPSAATTIITGNWSINTWGSQSASFSGTNGVTWANNQFDKTPTPTVTSCGTGPVDNSGGTVSGGFVTGSGAGTSCLIQFPFPLRGFGGGSCQFSTNGGVDVSSSVGGGSGPGPLWHLTFASAWNSGVVFYNCPGAQ